MQILACWPDMSCSRMSKLGNLPESHCPYQGTSLEFAEVIPARSISFLKQSANSPTSPLYFGPS